MSQAAANPRRSRLQIILSGAEDASHAMAERWLIQLRWVAIGGMLATTVIAKAIAPGIAAAPIGGLVALIAATNVAWMVIVERAERRGRDEAESARIVTAQIASDLVALTAVLWFSGGTENPFATFVSFQIAIAGLLCSGRVTFGILLLTLACVGVLSQAPPLPLDGAVLRPETIRRTGTVVSLGALSVFLGVFVYFYTRRLDALRHASARNEKLAMLGRLVGGMSHELATPLATVLLAGKELALATEGKDAETAELARTVAKEAQRASDIILLMRGQVRPDQLAERVELAELVEAFSARELDRLGFEGERHFRARRQVHATVLRAGLEQILRNLLRNAVDAARDSERPPRVDVSVRARGDLAEITVEDSGRGFSPEILPRLGEPFQTTKEMGEGMGLGLYVSSVLAERMRGHLRLESAPGGGARVTLSFRRNARRPG